MILANKWAKLQNGSDIRGVAIEGVEGEPVNLTKDAVYFISSAFVEWLSRRTGKKPGQLRLAIGTDSRLSGQELKAAAIDAITSSQADAADCGIASTPAMFMSCVLPGLAYDGSVMITASHLPFNRNGMKFFTGNGGLEKKEITEILELAQVFEETAVPSGSRGMVTDLDLISIYANDILQKIRAGADSATDYERPLKGLKIIVDAGNGAGGFFAGKVLDLLGADTSGSQFLDPDGRFPNHVPNPEDETAMDSIREAVLKNHADFGIIFDTDVDRAGAVDKDGREINRNRIIAVMSAIVLEEHPGSTIVTDSITSSELKDFIEKNLGGRHHRFKRGYKNVINEAIRLNKTGTPSFLAIETSGHGALKENYFMDDGSFMIAKMLIKIAKLREKGETIDMLIQDLAEPVESKEFRFKINRPDFKKYGEEVLAGLSDYAQNMDGWKIAPDNYEGIRVSLDSGHGNGWFLLRMSLHDPLMPLNIESNDVGGVKEIAGRLYEFIRKCTDLDLSDFAGFLS
ncbi:MAG: phosphohexomutase domain-containing protein [Saccharofermentanales bacterium]